MGTSTLIGLTSETRDKIINNLHPEVCRVKVPFSGTCNQLFHCDDNGQNCTERTSTSGTILLDSANCIWQVPFYEFSTYRESTSSGSSGGSSSSSGGGGGGSGGAVSKNKTGQETVEGEAPSSEGESAGESPANEREEGGAELSPQERGREEVNIILWIIPAVIIIFGIVVAVYLGMKSGKKARDY